MEGSEGMRLVPINCVREGTRLGKTIYNIEGRVLLSKDVKLTEGLINKIRENGIMSIYINDEYSDSEIEDVIKPEIRQRAIKVTKDNFKGIVDSKKKNLNRKKAIEIKYKSMEQIKVSVNHILDDMFNNKDLFINLVDIKSYDNYIYEHSVNVTTLALAIGIELNLDRDKLFNLAVGTMLHDVGKVLISKDIVMKNREELTEEENEIIKHHTINGYEYLKDSININAVSRIIVLQHHEKLNGTGYPNKLKNEQINQLSKIVAVADTYDTLTSHTPNRPGISPNDALEYMMAYSGVYFEYNIIKAFMKRVIPYPVGTLVKLSNGDYGVVDSVVPDFPLRPKVRVIRQKATRIEQLDIDLMKEPGITIKRIQYESPDLSVQTYLKNK